MSEVEAGQAADAGSASDQTRRRFLTMATTGVSAAGVVGVAVPFMASWNPSEKAKAAGAPVKADISKIEPGQMVVVEWRGKPVYVLRRTPEQVAGLPSLDDNLKDPNSDTSGSARLHQRRTTISQRRVPGGCWFVHPPRLCTQVPT